MVGSARGHILVHNPEGRGGTGGWCVGATRCNDARRLKLKMAKAPAHGPPPQLQPRLGRTTLRAVGEGGNRSLNTSTTLTLRVVGDGLAAEVVEVLLPDDVPCHDDQRREGASGGLVAHHRDHLAPGACTQQRGQGCGGGEDRRRSDWCVATTQKHTSLRGRASFSQLIPTPGMSVHAHTQPRPPHKQTPRAAPAEAPERALGASVDAVALESSHDVSE